MTREHAYQLRELMHKASTNLDDSDALDAIELFPLWHTDTAYEAAERVRYCAKLYRCEQSHTSQGNWTPNTTPALWTEVARPGEIPVWHQPKGSHDAYRIGEKVHYPDQDGPVYVCVMDYNIYAPGVAGWELVEE